MQDRAAHRLATAASVVSGATFLSRILGYLRDMIIAHGFGAGLAADAFFVAFRIPSMFRELLGEGALSAAFIPVFTETLSRRGRSHAFRMAMAAFWALSVLLLLVCLLGVLVAPALVSLLAPGFRIEPGKFTLTVTLTRVMFPYLLFVGLTALMMGVLNSLGHFAAPALSPAFLNIAIILSALFWAPHLEEPILALAYGVVIGGILQLLCQVPPALRHGVAFTECGDWREAALARIARLMVPGVAGLAITQVNVFMTTLFASFLVEGSVSFLYYAFRLVHLPVGLIGVAVATAVFPAMAAAVAQEAPEELKKILTFALRLTFFVTVPALVGLLVYRSTIIRLLFERGAFTPEATASTAYALVGYSLGLCFFVVNRILVPAFHAFQDTATPVKAGAIAVATNILFSLLLMHPFQAAGLAIATSISSAVNFSLLVVFLRRRLGPFGAGAFARPLQKTCLAGLSMLVAFVALNGLLPAHEGLGPFRELARFLGELGLGTAVFFGAATLLGCEEVRLLRDLFRRGLGWKPSDSC